MATVTKPIALDESLNTTEQTPRNIADVLAQELSRITGRNASQVEYDNTDSGLTADNVQDAIDEVNGKVPTLPTTDIQTAVDEFETYNGGLLSECKVALSPNQDLHGYSEPWAGGAGKNKAPLRLSTIKSLNTIGTWSNNVYVESGITATFYTLSDTDDSIVKIHVQGTATAPVNILLLTENDVSWLGSLSTVTVNGSPSNAQVNTECLIVNVNGGNSLYIESSKNISVSNVTAFRFRLGVWNGKTVNSDYYPMVRDVSVVDDSFAPYSNICQITGHTQSKVRDDGKNRAIPPENGVYSGVNGAFNSSNTYAYVVADVEPNKLYTVSAEHRGGIGYVLFYKGTLATPVANFISAISIGDVASYTFTTPEECTVVVYETGGSAIPIQKDTIGNVQIEEGSTATPYEPYNGYQVTVNLGGTYYSGTLDVVTGVFTPDTAIATASDFTFTAGKSDGDLAKVEYTPSNFKNSIEKLKCNMMPYVEQSASWTETEPCYTIASGTKLRVYFDGDTLADFQRDFADIQIVYELATPTSIQLSPTMVKALVGENHLSAPLEGQEITESKYRELFTWDEVESYVNAHSGGGSGMNYSTEEQVIGTWIDGKPLYQKSISITGVSIPTNQTVTIYTQANIKMKYFSGYLTENDTTYVIPEVGVRIRQSGDNIQISSQSGASWTISEGYVTIRYTKTTD